MSQANQGFSLKRQLVRGKKAAAMTGTIARGMKTLHALGAFKQPPRDILPRHIQNFCRKMTGAFDVKVVEVEPVPSTHAIWASNHLSWMDIPVVGSVCPAFFLSKAEIGDWFIFGKLMKGSGQLLIKRGSGDANAVTEQITGFLKDGHSIVIFPEGTTTDGTKIKKVHGKLFQSAIDASVPVQPVVVCYLNEDGSLSKAMPYHGKMTMKQSMMKVLDANNITAYVLPLEPIQTDGMTKEQVTATLQQRMEDGLVELHSRVVVTKPTNLTVVESDKETEKEMRKVA